MHILSSKSSRFSNPKGGIDALSGVVYILATLSFQFFATRRSTIPPAQSELAARVSPPPPPPPLPPIIAVKLLPTKTAPFVDSPLDNLEHIVNYGTFCGVTVCALISSVTAIAILYHVCNTTSHQGESGASGPSEDYHDEDDSDERQIEDLLRGDEITSDNNGISGENDISGNAGDDNPDNPDSNDDQGPPDNGNCTSPPDDDDDDDDDDVDEREVEDLLREDAAEEDNGDEDEDDEREVEDLLRDDGLDPYDDTGGDDNPDLNDDQDTPDDKPHGDSKSTTTSDDDPDDPPPPPSSAMDDDPDKPSLYKDSLAANIYLAMLFGAMVIEAVKRWLGLVPEWTGNNVDDVAPLPVLDIDISSHPPVEFELSLFPQLPAKTSPSICIPHFLTPPSPPSFNPEPPSILQKTYLPAKILPGIYIPHFLTPPTIPSLNPESPSVVSRLPAKTSPGICVPHFLTSPSPPSINPEPPSLILQNDYLSSADTQTSPLDRNDPLPSITPSYQHQTPSRLPYFLLVVASTFAAIFKIVFLRNNAQTDLIEHEDTITTFENQPALKNELEHTALEDELTETAVVEGPVDQFAGEAEVSEIPALQDQHPAVQTEVTAMDNDPENDPSAVQLEPAIDDQPVLPSSVAVPALKNEPEHPALEDELLVPATREEFRDAVVAEGPVDQFGEGEVVVSDIPDPQPAVQTESPSMDNDLEDDFPAVQQQLAMDDHPVIPLSLDDEIEVEGGNAVLTACRCQIHMWIESVAVALGEDDATIIADSEMASTLSSPQVKEVEQTSQEDIVVGVSVNEDATTPLPAIPDSDPALPTHSAQDDMKVDAQSFSNNAKTLATTALADEPFPSASNRSTEPKVMGTFIYAERTPPRSKKARKSRAPVAESHADQEAAEIGDSQRADDLPQPPHNPEISNAAFLIEDDGGWNIAGSKKIKSKRPRSGEDAECGASRAEGRSKRKDWDVNHYEEREVVIGWEMPRGGRRRRKRPDGKGRD